MMSLTIYWTDTRRSTEGATTVKIESKDAASLKCTAHDASADYLDGDTKLVSRWTPEEYCQVCAGIFDEVCSRAMETKK